MEYRYSTLVPPGTYDTADLAPGVPLRRSIRPLAEDIGALRAQEDWHKLVSPIKNHTGTLGGKFSSVQLAVPECIPERLEIISYANELAFIYDDFTELLGQSDLEKANDELQDGFTRPGQGDKSGSNGSRSLGGQSWLSTARRGFSLVLSLGLFRALRLWRSTRKSRKLLSGVKRLQALFFDEMKRIDEPRAKKSIKAWVEFLQEAAGREHEVAHSTLAEYMRYRILDVGEMYMYAITTFGMALDIPDDEWQPLRKVMRPVWASMALQNDIVSYDKELQAAKKKGVSHVVNALWVLMKEHNVDLDKAKELCKEEVKRHIETYQTALAEERKVRRFSKDSRTYMEAGLLMISANAAWSLNSPRYFPEQSYNALQLSMMANGASSTLGKVLTSYALGDSACSEEINALKTYLRISPPS